MLADSPERLGVAKLAIFSLPMVVVLVVEMAWRVYLPNFFATTLGLSLGTAGALLMAARLFDSVVDPAIGWASDRFPTRYGHRRPWLVASVPLVMLGAAGVFFVWPWTNVASLIAACLLLHLGYMMLVTPHGGWALELGRDPAERLRIMGAKTWFAVAGMIAVLTLPALLERTLHVGQAGQVAALGAMVILLCPICVFLVVRYVREPALPPSRSADLANPLRLFGGILRTPAMPPILLLYLLTGISDSASSAAFFFFVERGLELDGWGSTLLLAQAGVMLVAIPIWSKLGARLGARRMLMLAYGWQIVTMPLALVLPAGMFAPAAAFLLARGLFAGADHTHLRTMVAQVTRSSATTGLCHGASCYAVSNITLKIAMGAGAWLALALIGLRLDGSAESIANGVEMRNMVVRAVYALPPVIASLLGIGVLIFGRHWLAGVPFRRGHIMRPVRGWV